MEEYRSVKMQEDLLHYAVQQTFSNDGKVKIIKAVESALEPWAGMAMMKEGFTIESKLKKVGILGWSMHRRVLKRETWEQSDKA